MSPRNTALIPRARLPAGSPRQAASHGGRRLRRWGWSVSLLLHAGVLAGLCPVALPRQGDIPPAISVAACFAPTSAPDSFTVAARPATELAELTPQLVQTHIQTRLQEQQGRSIDEQFDRLDAASRQLNRLTSDVSLDEMAGRFQDWLGYAERATEPAPAVAGRFDETTAQLHDVTRHAQPDGSWTYRCVLLDAAGRTLEVDLDDEQGRRAYELMQRVRANPLLEKLYRGIVMPLFDHLKLSDAWTQRPSATSLQPDCEAKKRPAE